MNLAGSISVFENRRGTFFALLFFYAAVSILLVLSGRAYLGTVDDPYLREFLFHGENRTLIMSYPLSALLAFLYQKFPDVQWLSWTFSLYIFMIFSLYSWYLVHIQEKSVRYLAALFGLVVLVFVWTNVTVTILTLLTIVVALPLVKRAQIAFWSYVLAAALLRDSIIISVSPLLLLAYLFLFDRSYFNLKRALAIGALIVSIVLSILSPQIDRPYQEWLKFYHARVYFTDLHGDDRKHLFDENERLIAYSWFAQDEALLPTEKIVAAAGSKFEVIKYRFAHLKPRRVLSMLYHHKIVFVLLFFSLYLMRCCEKNRIKTAVLTLFIVGFFVLFFIRDVERVTYPMIFIWMILLSIELLKYDKIRALRLLFASSALVLLIDLPLYGRNHTMKDWSLRDEMVALIQKDSSRIYEPALGFPAKVDGNFVSALEQNRLFEEKEWISNFIVPAGWMSRHPYFYRSHRIDFGGIKRKYATYYDYLISPYAVFIGSNSVDEETNRKILKMYDHKHPFGGSCRHEAVRIEGSKHFSVFRIVSSCTEEKAKKSFKP